MALRLSGGVAHAMAVSTGVSADDRAVSIDKVGALCGRSRAQIGPLSSGRSGPVRAGNPGHEVAFIPRAIRDQIRCPRQSRFVTHSGLRIRATIRAANGCADHQATDARSVLGTVQGSSLRSARACAWPAGLDGACAQIASWPLRDGRRCDGAKLDRSCLLTAAPSGVSLFSFVRAHCTPSARGHFARSAEGRRSQGKADSPLPDFSTVLNRDRSQSHFEIRDSQSHTASLSGHAAAVHHRDVVCIAWPFERTARPA